MFLHSDQFKPKSHLKLIKKNIFSEGEQFPLTGSSNIGHWVRVVSAQYDNIQMIERPCIPKRIQFIDIEKQMLK